LMFFMGWEPSRHRFCHRAPSGEAKRKAGHLFETLLQRAFRGEV
jgi:hypothetical protein